jgi:hypothetical protein
MDSAIRQFGTGEHDRGENIALDSAGNAYVVGDSSGWIFAPNPNGNEVGYLSKFDPTGNLIWANHFGDVSITSAFSVATNQHSDVYIAGFYSGSTLEEDYFSDVYVAKYDQQGAMDWWRRIGTTNFEHLPVVKVAPDESVVFAASSWVFSNMEPDGPTGAFFTKYSAQGEHQWTRFLSEPGLAPYAIEIDNDGNIYTTNGPGGSLSRFDASGELVWTRQIGVSGTETYSIATDPIGNVYVTGETLDSLDGQNAGRTDAFVSKIDANGQLIWTKQFGGAVFDVGGGITTDDFGRVYVTGIVDSNHLDWPNSNADIFVETFDGAGNLLWNVRFGSPANDYSGYGASIVVNERGEIFVTGLTYGLMGESHFGNTDAFIAKLSAPVPEPSSCVLVAISAIAITAQRFRRSSR